MLLTWEYQSDMFIVLCPCHNVHHRLSTWSVLILCNLGKVCQGTVETAEHFLLCVTVECTNGEYRTYVSRYEADAFAFAVLHDRTEGTYETLPTLLYRYKTAGASL